MTKKGGTAAQTRLKTVSLLVLTGLLWSLGGVFIKTTDAHPFVISSIRSFAAAAGIFAFLRFKPKFTFEKAQIAGAVFYAATLTTFVTANKLTTAANAILLQYSSPIFVVIISALILKESLRWYDYASIAGVSAGLVVLLFGSLELGSLPGNIVGVASGMLYAAMAVSLKMHKTEARVETILLGNILAVFVGLPFLFLYPPEPAAFAPVIFLGLFQIALPYIFYAKASLNASALDMSLIPVIEPVLNPVWVFAATGESPGANTYVGGIILISVISFRSLLMFRSQKH